MALQQNWCQLLVSVPSRGILFPNNVWWHGGKFSVSVSVPSRGILFPNSNFDLRYDDLVKSFRPLSGHLISKCKKTVTYKHFCFGFRPLSGHLISKYFQTKALTNWIYWFPSPLGASYFQILPARARYFAGFSDSFAWQIIFLYIFLISNIHNRLQMQYLCGARKNYKLYQYYLNSNFTF